MNNSAITIEDVRKLHLNTNDTLVLRLVDSTPELIEYSMKKLEEFFPDNRIIVLRKDDDIEVLAQNRHDGMRATGTCAKCHKNVSLVYASGHWYCAICHTKVT